MPIWKKEKATSIENNTNYYCKALDCPTPKNPIVLENLKQFNNENYCLFCYTKKIAEIDSKTIIQTKTKSVQDIQLKRIESTKKIFSDLNSQNITRIAPSTNSEKFQEELHIWNNIRPFIEKTIGKNLGIILNVKKINIDGYPRAIETKQSKIICNIVKKVNYKNIIEKENVFSQINRKYFNLYQLEIQELPLGEQNWIKIHWLQKEINSEIDYSLIIYEPNKTIISLDEINYTQKNENFLKTFSYNLGRFIYFSWFMGDENLFAIVYLTPDWFINFNQIQNKKMFDPTVLKTFIQNIPLKLPFVLDEPNIDQFTQGAQDEKKFLEKSIQDENFKKSLLDYYQTVNISFDLNSELQDLEMNLTI